MEDIYNTNVNNNGDKDHRPSDEMSLFVHQILLRSSSSSFCSSFTAHNEGFLPPSFSAPPYDSRKPSGGGYFSSDASSLAVGGVIENDNDECDCESEEGVEAVVDEEPVKRGPPRSSSKRSRASEVHNLSEKRRRSRINEKMKALQNLIPNSNKTDKASMLDEAIEYLKQLQLQVQMLSMRNGISLHPMCMPELLLPIQHSQSRTRSREENWSQQMDISGSFSLRQESSEHTMFGLPNQCTPSNHLSLPNMSSIVNSETSLGMESSTQGYFGSYLFHTPSEGILREDIVSNQLLISHPPDRKLSEFEMGATDTKSSFPFKTQASNLKDCSSVAGCEVGRDQTNEVLTKNIGQNLMSSSELNSIQTEKGTLGGYSRLPG